mgnify:CR=1 FL=1
MKNKFLNILFVFVVCLFLNIKADANNIEFNFDVTELEILDNTTAWTIISAADLSCQSTSTLLKWNMKYSDDHEIKS